MPTASNMSVTILSKYCYDLSITGLIEMLHYKFKKTEDGTYVHIILEDNFLAPCPTPRPPTELEIQAIIKRERIKKIRAILKDYKQHKKNMGVQ